MRKQSCCNINKYATKPCSNNPTVFVVACCGLSQLEVEPEADNSHRGTLLRGRPELFTMNWGTLLSYIQALPMQQRKSKR